MVETELGVVTRTELDVAIAELDSLEKYKAIEGSSLHIFPTEEVLCLNQTVADATTKDLTHRFSNFAQDSSFSKQKKYFAFNSTCIFGEIQSCRITCLAPKWGILR